MDERESRTGLIEAAVLAVVVAVLAAAGWSGAPSRFLVVHTLAELFVIVVAAGTAMIVWNSRRVVENGYLAILAIAGIFVAGIDLMHTMTYKGMSLLPFAGANVPTQLWLAGRYVQAGSILVASFFIGRRVRVRWVSLVCGAVSAVLLASILWLHVFPAAFVEGQGLTAFKNGSEYAAIAAMLVGLALLLARGKAFERGVLVYLAAFVLFLVAAEFAFTLYASVYARANLAGHLLRMLAAYALYRAIIVTAITRPYDLLFRELKQSEAALRDSERKFRTTFEEAGVGIALTGMDERFLSVNDRLTEIAGRPREELEALGPADITHPEDYDMERKLIAELVAGSRDSYNAEKRYVLPDGSIRWVSVTRSLLRGDDGEARSFVQVVEDIQLRREGEERLRRAKELSDALNDIDAAMNSSLDAGRIMHEVVDRGAEALGVEAIRLSLRDGERWIAQYARGFDDVEEGALFDDTEMPLELIAERTQQPLVVNDVAADTRIPGLERVRAAGVGSYLGVPLMFKDEVIGVLAFAKIGAAVPFAAEQVDFASRLATSLSLALENARLYAVEHRIADTLQEALLSPPPAMPGLELSHLYRSATEATRVGGDFYEVFEVAPDTVGIIVGDVSGKGLEAAALTTVVKTAVKANASLGGPPAQVMSRVNDFLHKHTAESAFVTVFYGVLDLTSGALRYCSGGHPPAMLRRADGTATLLATTSPLVGAFDDVGYCDEGEVLAVGDVLVLYTDGVIECRGGGEQFGEHRLLDAVAGWTGEPSGLPAAVLAAVQEHCGGVLGDDVAVVALARV